MKTPTLVAIINVTPDSFSGDGRYGDAAYAHACAQLEAGAAMLDVGAESTRPNATPITPEEEWGRLAPVLKRLCAQPIPVSVDTRHAQTATRALEAGATLINDVSGLATPEMRAVLARHHCDVVVMHSLSLPANPAIVWGEDIDPIQEILRWKADVVAGAEADGIAPERLIFDAGLGFGKTARQSLRLALSAEQLTQSGGRWLFGHSRKSFLSLFTQSPAADRDALTLAFSAMLAEKDVNYLRVHNIAAHRQLFDGLCM